MATRNSKKSFKPSEMDFLRMPLIELAKLMQEHYPYDPRLSDDELNAALAEIEPLEYAFDDAPSTSLSDLVIKARIAEIQNCYGSLCREPEHIQESSIQKLARDLERFAGVEPPPVWPEAKQGWKYLLHGIAEQRAVGEKKQGGDATLQELISDYHANAAGFAAIEEMEDNEQRERECGALIDKESALLRKILFTPSSNSAEAFAKILVYRDFLADDTVPVEGEKFSLDDGGVVVMLLNDVLAAWTPKRLGLGSFQLNSRRPRNVIVPST